MSLQTEYNAAVDASFIAKVAMALLHKAVPIMLAGDESTPAAIRQLRLAIRVVRGPQSFGAIIAPALAQAGLSAASTDNAIQTAINDNFAALSWLADETQGA